MSFAMVSMLGFAGNPTDDDGLPLALTVVRIDSIADLYDYEAEFVETIRRTYPEWDATNVVTLHAETRASSMRIVARLDPSIAVGAQVEIVSSWEELIGRTGEDNGTAIETELHAVDFLRQAERQE